VSSMGFAFGYIGGVILFAFNVWMMVRPETFGLGGWADAVKVSFLSVAVWWMVFSIPLLLFVKEKNRKASTRKKLLTAAVDAVSAVKKTFLAIIRRKELFLFLAAYWLYYDGINTFIRMAVDFGLSIGFGPEALMAALVISQLTAFPASLLFGYLSAKIGAGRMISAGVLMYLVISIVGSLLMRTETHFIILAALTGLAQGGIQALSRSYFGKLIPPEESTEYFGFYNVVSRFAVAGPAVVGLAATAAKGAGGGETAASRIGMSSIALFFAAGLIFLRMSRKARQAG